MVGAMAGASGSGSDWAGLPHPSFLTAAASGVTTGEAAPTNSVSEESPALLTQTLPDPSMASPVGESRPPPL